MSTFELQVADRFPPGTKVGVYPRIHDFFTPGQTPAVTQATVGKNGVLKVGGLVAHGPYFLAAEVDVRKPTSLPPDFSEEAKEWRSVAFTASDASPALTADAANAQADREAQARAKVFEKTAIDTATAPGGAPIQSPAPIIEGARDTSVLSERIEGTKKGTPLASHTATGEAVVVGEEVPKQEDVHGSTKQQSDTEAGVAAPLEPRPSQEDLGGRTPQASSTETGEGTPLTGEQIPEARKPPTTARKTSARKKASSAKKTTKKGSRR